MNKEKLKDLFFMMIGVGGVAFAIVVGVYIGICATAGIKAVVNFIQPFLK